jgi:hypothetical protein
VFVRKFQHLSSATTCHCLCQDLEALGVLRAGDWMQLNDEIFFHGEDSLGLAQAEKWTRALLANTGCRQRAMKAELCMPVLDGLRRLLEARACRMRAIERNTLDLSKKRKDGCSIASTHGRRVLKGGQMQCAVKWENHPANDLGEWVDCCHGGRVMDMAVEGDFRIQYNSCVVQRYAAEQDLETAMKDVGSAVLLTSHFDCFKIAVGNRPLCVNLKVLKLRLTQNGYVPVRSAGRLAFRRTRRLFFRKAPGGSYCFVPGGAYYPHPVTRVKRPAGETVKLETPAADDGPGTLPGSDELLQSSVADVPLTPAAAPATPVSPVAEKPDVPAVLESEVPNVLGPGDSSVAVCPEALTVAGLAPARPKTAKAKSEQHANRKALVHERAGGQAGPREREALQQHDEKHVCSAWGRHLRCVSCNQRARSYHPESCVLLAIHCMDGRKVSVRAPLSTKVHELKAVAGRSIDVAPGLIGMFVAEREEALPDDAALGSLGIDFASSDTSKSMLFMLFRPGWWCSRCI